MSALQLTEYVRRPGVGTVGRPVLVRSNHFEVTKLPCPQIHHYDITITPDVPMPVNRKVFEQFLHDFKRSDLADTQPVYDGRKNLFSSRAFPFDKRDFQLTLASDMNNTRQPAPFKIKIKKVALIDLQELQRFLQAKSPMTNNCLTAIMAIDVLIRHKPTALYRTVGRSFFTPAGSKSLPGSVEAWRGFYQSARPALGRMLISVDVSVATFYQSGSLLEIVIKILGLRTLDDLRRANVSSMQWARVERQLKGLRVQLTHRERAQRPFKIVGLTKEDARNTVFKIRLGPRGPTAPGTPSPTTISLGQPAKEPPGEEREEEIDVASYFQQVYNIRLNYPLLPCVVLGRVAKVPMEFCRVIEGQRYLRRLDEPQTAEMMKFANMTPQVRANTIRNGMQLLDYDNNEYLNEFGMKVSKDMATIPARVLPPPTLQYHPASAREASFIPREGAWSLSGKRLNEGASLGSWGVMVFATERDIAMGQVQQFLRMLISTCSEMGIRVIMANPPILFRNPRSGNIEQHLKELWLASGNAAKSKPQLLVCVLPNKWTQLYAEIKRATDTIYGVCSQCLLMAHVLNPKRSYCSNVCLKINVKLGGVNAELAQQDLSWLTAKPTIILGGDVSHPQPGDMIRPSIASLVGSTSPKAARYAATVRIQTARTETIADLTSMTIELLRIYYQSCKSKPERILFFRDGVSEGQFPQVLKQEISALRAACLQLDASYRPLITFIIIRKRHHTRFFPTRPSGPECADRSGNCRPGTVVDQGIVHPFEFDFFLQSHAGRLGTSRPAHYNVLQDDSNMSADEMQTLVYRLCHLQARCVNTVSVVPAVFYAHLVGVRARYHAKGDVFSETESAEESLILTSGKAGEEREKARSGATATYSQVHPDLIKED
ncbi:Eukaryotic translation initiation factor 2C [Mortierella claussenii]|nr:Eukaryotic translation initiation factor 2C [Mortierella claussenii]